MKIVTCIKCGKEGRLNDFHPSNSNFTQYYVGHETLGYGWGTSKKTSEQVEAIRRCYMTKPFQRTWAKQKLGEL